MDRNLQVRLLYCTKCILLGFWLVLISKPTSSGQGISNIWVMDMKVDLQAMEAPILIFIMHT